MSRAALPAVNSQEAETRSLAKEALPSLGGFGATEQDLSLAPTQPLRDRAAPEFDLCHVGVLLRVVLAVHGVLVVGAGIASDGWSSWASSFALASAFALPALLAWLAGGCALHRWLPQSSVKVRRPMLAATGAICAWAPWQIAALVQGAAYPTSQGLAVALAGAGLAWTFVWWLEQRSRQLAPSAASARLAELQSRIRPHFLFNTLNTAIALVRLDPGRAEAVLEDLAELFRVALAESQPGAVTTLGEEIELGRRYLAIEQLRFGSRLEIQWELDPDADRARLPPLLLQPLLENAVRHGVEPAPEGGRIRVRTRVRRGMAEVTMVNSTPAGGSPAGHGLALDNVRQRLLLMHDVAATFRAGREGGVFRVEVAVPL